MATAGPNTCGTAADDATVGTVAWLNPTNAQGASDGVYTTNVAGPKALSHYLLCTNFSFAIPAGSTINGITVEFYRHATIAATDMQLRIVKGGTIGATDRAIGNWAAADQWDLAGSASDLWGETWTATDINDSAFGVALAINGVAGIADLDAARITIDYTFGDPVNPKVGVSRRIEAGQPFDQGRLWVASQLLAVPSVTIYTPTPKPWVAGMPDPRLYHGGAVVHLRRDPIDKELDTTTRGQGTYTVFQEPPPSSPGRFLALRGCPVAPPPVEPTRPIPGPVCFHAEAPRLPTPPPVLRRGGVNTVDTTRQPNPVIRPTQEPRRPDPGAFVHLTGGIATVNTTVANRLLGFFRQEPRPPDRGAAFTLHGGPAAVTTVPAVPRAQLARQEPRRPDPGVCFRLVGGVPSVSLTPRATPAAVAKQPDPVPARGSAYSAHGWSETIRPAPPARVVAQAPPPRGEGAVRTTHAVPAVAIQIPPPPPVVTASAATAGARVFAQEPQRPFPGGTVIQSRAGHWQLIITLDPAVAGEVAVCDPR